MSNGYFSFIPLVKYNGSMVTNIVLKSAFFQSVLDNYSAFYPYIVQDEDRADLVAHHYYGDWQYDWLVYFSNQMMDPYFDWPLNARQFDTYIIGKYGSFVNAVETIRHHVYDPTVDRTDKEASYKVGYEMDPVTYQFLTVEEQSFWNPVSFYDWEHDKNENKRNIKLLDSRLLPQIDKEITTIFRETT